MNRHERRAFDKQRRRGMKIQFSKEVEFTPEWNKNKELPKAEQIKAILKPLSVSDLILIIEALSRTGAGEQAENTAIMKNLMGNASHLLNTYCTLEGLYNGDVAVTSKELGESPYYMELAAEILSELSVISLPNEGEEKNLQKQPV